MRGLVFSIAVLATPAVHAADGVPDPGFGINGIVEIAWPAGYAAANAVGLDGSGRMIFGGTAAGPFGDTDFALFRLLPDGTLDTSYASDVGGFRLIDFDLDGIGEYSLDAINDLAIAADGSTTALGEAHFGYGGVNSQFALARVDADATLDPTFGNGGLVHFGSTSFANIDYGRALVIDAEQRIVVMGRIAEYRDNTLAFAWWIGLGRLTADGEFDPAFFEGGFFRTIFWTDPTIPPPRYSLYNTPISLALDDSERILVSGAFEQPIPQDAALFRAPPDGGFDETFGVDSRTQLGLELGEASALLPLAGGGMMVAGASGSGAGSYSLFLSRRLDDGSADATFGTNGITLIALAEGYPEPTLIAPTRGGGWLVGGRLTPTSGSGGPGVVVARFDANGQPDAGFGNGGIALFDVADGRHFSAGRVALQADGRLVVAGSLPNSIEDQTPHFAAMRIFVDHELMFADGFETR
jgi:uncharacterized delta-60 repeat protein